MNEAGRVGTRLEKREALLAEYDRSGVLRSKQAADILCRLVRFSLFRAVWAVADRLHQASQTSSSCAATWPSRVLSFGILAIPSLAS
jgi:hypothetical protein